MPLQDVSGSEPACASPRVCPLGTYLGEGAGGEVVGHASAAVSSEARWWQKLEMEMQVSSAKAKAKRQAAKYQAKKWYMEGQQWMKRQILEAASILPPDTPRGASATVLVATAQLVKARAGL